jgi:chromate reductase, NAD(P)H dehydrogenase (quinone)
MRKILFLCSCLLLALPLSAQIKVLAFAGSTRADSYNKKLVQDAAEIARSMKASVTVIDLKDYPMPFYDGDLEEKEGMPKNAKLLQTLMIESDAIIIATPEYNASISAVLKNALDWVSRGEGAQRAFKDKRFALMSASPGKLGGARALKQLRPIIETLGGIPTQLQVSIPDASDYFAEEKRAENPQLREEIKELLQSGSKKP